MDRSLVKIAVDFLVGLIPQKDDDAMQLYQWRWKSVVMGLLAMAVGAYGSSFIPGVKPPYAMAETVEQNQQDTQKKFDAVNGKMDAFSLQMAQVQAQLKDGQVRQLNTDLLDAKRYQCRAIHSEDKSALPFWNDRLQSLKLDYQRLTGEQWPDLDCNSF